jgi:uncharacterized membrane protein YedE/YeeE
VNPVTTLDERFESVALRGSINPAPAVVALMAITALTLYLNVTVSLRQSMLFLIGAAAGMVLYHAAFGFTASWRAFVHSRRGAGIRAQMLMLALTAGVFFPLLASGAIFGQPVRGNVSPIGFSVLAGAFLFGLGMQLGGGCASGTLYSAGGGNTRMLMTLVTFIAGSVIGSAHMPWWSATPAFKPVSLVTTFGVPAALAITFGLLALLTAMTAVMERRRHGRIEDDSSGSAFAHRLLRGPWPLLAGAVGLAAVNIATLALSGRPWGITSAFALWGAKALLASGVSVASWPYWSAPAQAAALHAPVTADVTSVMDAGIMLGALFAAGIAGRFAPSWRVSPRPAAAALAGGLMLGYGARIAYGCNIGAYFGGIASGSVHGWVWLAAAFAGTTAGTRLRPFFGLSR